MTDSTQHPENPQPDASPPVEPASSPPPAPPASPRPPARTSTVVWGLIIVVVGAGVVARALGADFDNQLALIVLLAAAGVALVTTSIVSAVRRR